MHLPLRHCSCHQSAELVLWTWTCSDLVDVSQVFLKMLVRSNQLLIISIMLASFTWWIHTLCKRCGCSDRTCLNKQLCIFLAPCLKTTIQNNLLFPQFPPQSLEFLPFSCDLWGHSGIPNPFFNTPTMAQKVVFLLLTLKVWSAHWHSEVLS